MPMVIFVAMVAFVVHLDSLKYMDKKAGLKTMKKHCAKVCAPLKAIGHIDSQCVCEIKKT